MVLLLGLLQCGVDSSHLILAQPRLGDAQEVKNLLVSVCTAPTHVHTCFVAPRRIG